MSADAAALLRRLEAERIAAVLAQDFDALEALTHSDLVYIHSSGRIDDRASLLAVLRAGGLEYHSIDESLETFATSGEQLWASGTSRSELMGGGRRLRIDSLVTVLWTRGQDRWRFRSFQGTASGAS